MKENIDIEELLLENGYEGVTYLTNESYDDAVIGVTSDGQVVYDFDKMVEWLVEKDGISEDEAIEWIEYNTIRALSYMGENHPVVMYKLNT